MTAHSLTRRLATAAMVLGLGSLAADVLARRRHAAAPWWAFANGCALLIWLIVEIAIVGYSNHPPLQLLYLGLGVVMTLVGAGWIRQTTPIADLIIIPRGRDGPGAAIRALKGGRRRGCAKRRCRGESR